MDYLYSLYDALVSINVPSDKARAVVDAMERDMGTTLATKQDIASVRQEIQLVRQEIQFVKQEMDGRFALVNQKFDTMELRMTVKLGSMIVASLGLTIAALRFWA